MMSVYNRISPKDGLQSIFEFQIPETFYRSDN